MRQLARSENVSKTSSEETGFVVVRCGSDRPEGYSGQRVEALRGEMDVVGVMQHRKGGDVCVVAER